MTARFALIVLLIAASFVAAASELACPVEGPAVAGPITYLPPDTSFAVPRSSVDPATLAPNKQTIARLYLTAVEAGILVDSFGDRMLFVDVRTRSELVFNGMPSVVDAHVPFLLDPLTARWDDAQGAFALERNPDFVTAVDRRLAQKQLTRDAVVVLICQGGGRAAMAANALTRAGFANVYSVVDGFEGDPAPDGPMKGQRVINGWRNAGLPWTTKLDRKKMYGVD